MDKNMSMGALEILDGLQEALSNAKRISVKEVKKTIVYRANPKNVCKSLHISQQGFSAAFGIPLATLRNWEQRRRKIDVTAFS